MSSHFFDKASNEVFSFMVDFTNRLETSEIIVEKIVSVIDKKTKENVTDDIIKLSTIYEKTVIVKVKEGIAKHSYRITIQITTSSNNVIVDNVTMHIVEE